MDLDFDSAKIVTRFKEEMGEEFLAKFQTAYNGESTFPMAEYILGWLNGAANTWKIVK
jgi:hypothetical protein